MAETAAPLAAAHTPPVGRKLMIIGNIDGELIGQDSRDAILTDRLIADTAPRRSRKWRRRTWFGSPVAIEH